MKGIIDCYKQGYPLIFGHSVSTEIPIYNANYIAKLRSMAIYIAVLGWHRAKALIEKYETDQL
ncbi:MAG: hypothetical protein Fur0044_31460 [Anaerolineae bacterium]